MPAMRSGKLPPLPVIKDGNDVGLSFKHGQNLICGSKDMPFSKDGSPFELEMTINPSAEPDGFHAGLFECMKYMQSGFRLVMNKKTMKLSVHTFSAPKEVSRLDAKTALVIGREYKINLRFEKGKAFLYLNGKLDGCVDTPPPAPCDSLIRIGVASGENYNFNGIIKRIAINML